MSHRWWRCGWTTPSTSPPARPSGFANTQPGADGPVPVFAVKPAKILAFGKGEFSHTRYRLS